MSEIIKHVWRASSDDSIATLLSRAVSDAEQVARAEIALQKARVAVKVGEAKTGVVALLAAVVLAILALIGLVVGVLMILTPVVGPVWATVIVVGVLAVLAIALGMFAMNQFKLMSSAPGKVP